MANHLKTVRITIGNDGQADVTVNQIAGIDQLTVNLAGQSGTGEASADTGGDIVHAQRGIELALGTIRKRDDGHGKRL
ncbi:hypothetical protein JHS3_02900 [Jeongeupia sp. HS-3]|nr:hypothetical protein JHS3_02900 [Jeongeupia sp. HS-3]